MLLHDCSWEGHPWIREDGVAPDKPIDSAVLSRMKQFTAMNKLKKMALRVNAYYFLPFFWFPHRLYRFLNTIQTVFGTQWERTWM
jgi:hypothetical protein